MHKQAKKITMIIAMIGGLIVQQLTAAQLYTETVVGPVVLPAGDYGPITGIPLSGGTLITSDITKDSTVFPDGEIILGGVDIVTHTVSFWYQTALLTDKPIYSVKTTANPVDGYSLNLKNDGNLELQVDTLDIKHTTNSAPVSANTWVHIAIVVTQNSSARTLDIQFFVNGALMGKVQPVPATTSSIVNGGLNALSFLAD
ncbi:MAG: hypothetical protein KAG98_05465, partial [Lentisphaeria bacterium]|nr:hypothetical protein [Lentisphaeria bacterium]